MLMPTCYIWMRKGVTHHKVNGHWGTVSYETLGSTMIHPFDNI